MPPETLNIEHVASPESLREAVHHLCVEGRCRWIGLRGLSASSVRNHYGSMGEIARIGLGVELRRPGPEIVVLDWSSVDECAADGIALFGVLVREVRARGIHVIACAPAATDLASVLTASGLREACGDIDWVPCAPVAGHRVASLGPVAVMGAGDPRPVSTFATALWQSLSSADVERDRAQRLVAVCVELLQNVLSHSGADHACAVALLYPRKRPQMIEIGISDSGRGIVAGVLSQERHAWLQSFTDASVASAALTRGLSGRAEEDGGGVLARVIRGLVQECEATVLVRSDAGLIRLSPPGRCEQINLSSGWGTQVLIRVRAHG